MGYLVNNEKVSKRQLMCIFGCFIGIVILSLSRSGIIGSTKVIKNTETKKVTDFQFNLGIFAISCTAICTSVVIVFTRAMKGIHFSIIQFHYGWISASLLTLMVLIEYISMKDNKDYFPNHSFRILYYNSF